MTGGRLSATKAVLLLPPNSPAKFRWLQDNPQPATPAMEFGSLVHARLLQDDEAFSDEFFLLDPVVHGLTKAGKVADNPAATTCWKDAAGKARADGLIPVTPDDLARADAMVASVRAHRWAGPLFADGQPEQRLEYADTDTGVLLTGRADWMTMVGGRVTIVEFKTAVSADPRAWMRKAADFGYDIQWAWYLALAALMDIDTDPQMYVVVAEKEPPHLVSVIEPPARAVALGAVKMRDAVDLYHRCRVLDEWPGYEGISSEDLPPWSYNYIPQLKEIMV